jgi:tRNA threonylcarbamoyladenosine biosynthesis protein TsaB
MKILALDTSASACSVALLINDEVHLLHEVAPMQQAKRVLSMIHELLEKQNIKLQDLDALAFGCGPGSFTGVRIAASVMQGFAFATSLPLIKVSSLAAVAQGAYQNSGWDKIMVGMDARIREVYWGVYQIDNSGIVRLVGEEKVCAPQEVFVPEGEGWYAAGSAWGEYQEALLEKLPIAPIAMDASCLPLASAIIELAKNKYLKQEFTHIADAMPVYLRDNVALK